MFLINNLTTFRPGNLEKWIKHTKKHKEPSSYRGDIRKVYIDPLIPNERSARGIFSEFWMSAGA